MLRLQTAATVGRSNGWVTERSIVHAWKACVPKGTGGSNPPPSARAFRVPRFVGLEARLSLICALFNNLQFLSQLDHAAMGENTAKVYAWINHAIATDNRAGIDHCVAADLRSIANDCAEFSEARRNVAIGCYDRNFRVVELYV